MVWYNARKLFSKKLLFSWEVIWGEGGCQKGGEGVFWPMMKGLCVQQGWVPIQFQFCQLRKCIKVHSSIGKSSYNYYGYFSIHRLIFNSFPELTELHYAAFAWQTSLSRKLTCDAAKPCSKWWALMNPVSSADIGVGSDSVCAHHSSSHRIKSFDSLGSQSSIGRSSKLPQNQYRSLVSVRTRAIAWWFSEPVPQPRDCPHQNHSLVRVRTECLSFENQYCNRESLYRRASSAQPHEHQNRK